MNLDAIKAKLANMQQSGNKQDSQKEKLPKWKPTIGKQVIRIVPSKFNKDTPFTEMLFYYNIGSRKVIASPLNWGEKDPIAEFAKQLRGTNDKEQWVLSKKLDPKMRVFAPVIVRGEEEKGVQIWEFGKKIYESLLQLAADEEVGDFTDVMVGRDLKLTTVGPDVTKTKYNETTFTISIKTSPLSNDGSEVESWLENQMDIKEAYSPLSFDLIKEALQEWLSPDEDEEQSTDQVETEAPKSFTLKQTTNQPKKSKVDEFDEAFGDEDKNDGLPF